MLLDGLGVLGPFYGTHPPPTHPFSFTNLDTLLQHQNKFIFIQVVWDYCLGIPLHAFVSYFSCELNLCLDFLTYLFLTFFEAWHWKFNYLYNFASNISFNLGWPWPIDILSVCLISYFIFYPLAIWEML